LCKGGLLWDLELLQSLQEQVSRFATVSVQNLQADWVDNSGSRAVAAAGLHNKLVLSVGVVNLFQVLVNSSQVGVSDRIVRLPKVGVPAHTHQK